MGGREGMMERYSKFLIIDVLDWFLMKIMIFIDKLERRLEERCEEDG